MTAIVLRVLGTNQPVVYHHCGQRMQHLNTYMIGGATCSDWWCNKCAEANDVWGDEANPIKQVIEKEHKP